MRAGRLDRRVTIQRSSAGQSGSGAYVPTWSDLAEVSAEVVDLRGREFFAARQVNSEITTKFMIRYRDVTVRDRIQYQGKTYDLKQVSEIGRRVGLEILAVAVPAVSA